MTLTELPAENPSENPRYSRKRARVASSKSAQKDVVVPPIQVDKDLLLQVVRTKVQTLLRNRREQEKAAVKVEDPYKGKCTAEKLEKLLPVIEQQWLQELLDGKKPRYGFDEVVKVLQDILHAETEGGEKRRDGGGV